MTARVRLQDRTEQRILWGLVIIMAAGLLITGGIFWGVRDNELEQFRQGFENDASFRAHLIQYKLDTCVMVTETLVQLFYASTQVEPHEFRAFTLPLLMRTQEMSAIAWIPVVPFKMRAGFEEYGHRTVKPSFMISEHDPGQRNVPARQRNVYYPLFYIESAQGLYGDDQGFDMGSVPEMLAAFSKAAETEDLLYAGRWI